MAQKQVLQQQLKQTLSPQQLLVVSLLECPLLELENKIQQELEENPALEEGVDHTALNASDEEQMFDEMGKNSESSDDNTAIDINDYLSDDESEDFSYAGGYVAESSDYAFVNYSSSQNFTEYLQEQVRMLNESEERMQMAAYIVGNLDEKGYLDREISLLTVDFNLQFDKQVTETDMFEALADVQSLDPAGVGARSLDECLLLQLERKPFTPSIDNAMRILEECYEAFAQRHYDKVQNELQLSATEMREAIQEITALNPRPSNGYSDTDMEKINAVTPDFLYDSETDELRLNNQSIPPLRVGANYVQLFQDYSGNVANRSPERRAAVIFAKQKLDRAKSFIEAVKQRETTLLTIMRSIIISQRPFFQSGDEFAIKPLTMKEVAMQSNCEISTVSRAVGNKYIQTNFGIFPLKYFFSEGMITDSGEEVSTREIKSLLKEMIESEDKKQPLPDEKLCELLQQKGYPIARRTVAKYREQLGLPVARLRKSF
ncbi:MAG: RNA polymerase factor sigma-54 [Paludibacteraceae bacterium]|nr:RNA polymerase factor sigma-54 [Paludibacteraceae bacterium]